MQYLIKIIVSAILITLVSEIAKRSSFWGAILVSLPFLSIIAFLFLYYETQNIEKVSKLSISIFWLVIPSLVLFLALPYLLKKGLDFYLSLGLSCVLTVVAYFLMTFILEKLGISI